MEDSSRDDIRRLLKTLGIQAGVAAILDAPQRVARSGRLHGRDRRLYRHESKYHECRMGMSGSKQSEFA